MTNKFDNAGDRYWDGKISGVMNTCADIIEVAKKYGIEVEE